MIPSHSPDTLEVTEHACYHPRNASDTFEEDESCDPLLLRHYGTLGKGVVGCWLRLVAGDKVHAPAQHAYGSKRCLLLPGMCLFVRSADGEDLLLGISVG